MTEVTIDKEAIIGLKKLFNEDFSNFVELYFSDFETKDKELHDSIQKSEIEAARKIAHALKGNSLNVGAMDLAKECENIEIAGRNGSIHEMMDAYQKLQKIYPTVKSTYLTITSSL